MIFNTAVSKATFHNGLKSVDGSKCRCKLWNGSFMEGFEECVLEPLH